MTSAVVQKPCAQYIPAKVATDISEAARTILRPGDARDRLTRGIFVSDKPRFRQARIEQAFTQAARVAPIEKTLREARRAGLLRGGTFEQELEESVRAGILSAEDAAELEQMQQLRREVVMVDSFARYGKQHALTTGRTRKPAIYAVRMEDTA